MRSLRVGLVLVLLVAAGFLLAPRCARLVLALEILDDLRRPGPHSWLRRATPAPTVTTIRLEHEGRRLLADFYRPARGASRVPVVFVPGMVEEGRRDPRVAPFASLLARAGFPTVVPDLPSLQALRVAPENLRDLDDAIDATGSRPDLAPEG